MNFYQRALELQEEAVAHRRYLHANAEVGLDLPKTRDYVKKVLTQYGLEPRDCGHGVTATIGSGGKCILLRADMDALPMAEESGEDFASQTGAAHTCGHDFHAAMLLTATRMLKQREGDLKGTVKLMFQPAEETFEGAKDMIAQGIMENPKVDAALAFHVSTGRMLPGLYLYNAGGAMMASVDGFRIEIAGKGAHGAYPQKSVDPINIAVHIYLALEALIAREVSPDKMCVMTVGKFQAGTAANIIPDTAVLEGTIRTNDPASREKLVRRMREVADMTARVYGGTAQVSMTSEVPPLICDGPLVNAVAEWMARLGFPNARAYPGVTANASEDFAAVAERVPACFMHLSAGFPDERGAWPAHNPRARFNEDVLPIGAAAYAACAQWWLEKQREP